jgi:hypothetical protein
MARKPNLLGRAWFWSPLRLTPAAIDSEASPPSVAQTSFHRFNKHRGSVGQDFCHALHNLGGVVSRANNCVRPELGCMLQHQIESFLPRLLTEIRKQRDIPAD